MCVQPNIPGINSGLVRLSSAPSDNIDLGSNYPAKEQNLTIHDRGEVHFVTRVDDFEDAHLRHWNDAELLLSCKRLSNADQLYGFSAECGLKLALVRLNKSPIREHVNILWKEFKKLSHGRRRSWFLRRLPKGSPFIDWSTNDRYVHSRCTTEEIVKKHRSAAQGIRRMIRKAKLEGRL